jgi:hypothetical protein
VTSPPNNSIVRDTDIKITTPYLAGVQIKIGNSTTTDLLMGYTQNNPQDTTGGVQNVHQDTTFTPSAAVVVTVTGATGATGAGVCIVAYVATPQS